MPLLFAFGRGHEPLLQSVCNVTCFLVGAAHGRDQYRSTPETGLFLLRWFGTNRYLLAAPSSQQMLQQTFIDARQIVQIIDPHTFIYLVNGSVQWP